MDGEGESICFRRSSAEISTPLGVLIVAIPTSSHQYDSDVDAMRESPSNRARRQRTLSSLSRTTFSDRRAA